MSKIQTFFPIFSNSLTKSGFLYLLRTLTRPRPSWLERKEARPKKNLQPCQSVGRSNMLNYIGFPEIFGDEIRQPAPLPFSFLLFLSLSLSFSKGKGLETSLTTAN